MSVDILNSQLVHELEQKTSIIRNIIHIMASDSSLKQILGYNTSDSNIVHFVNNYALPMVDILKNHLNEVKAVRIIHDNRNVFNVTNLLYYKDDFQEDLSGWSKAEPLFSVSYMKDTAKLYPFSSFSEADHDVWYISEYIQVYPTSRPIGIIEAAVSNDIFTDSIRNIVSDASCEFAFVCWDGQIPVECGRLMNLDLQTFDLRSGGRYSVHNGKEKLTIVIEPSELMNASVVTVIDENKLSLEPARQRQIVFIVLLSVLGVLIFAFISYNMILKRLHLLIKAVDEFEPDDQYRPLQESGNDEISRLIRHLNRMYGRLAKAKLMERKILYNELINQIRPHFVLNALEMLRLRASEEHADDVARGAMQINQYLRYTMTADTNTITLGDEIQNISNYVNLINEMRKNKINFSVTYDAWAESVGSSCCIPSMILQPLVENSIRHGIKDLDNCSIHIEVFRDQDRLIINIDDNGCGMPQETVESLNNGLIDRTCSEKKHIGLQYVRKKLDLYFNSHYSLHIDSIENVGTCITLGIDLTMLHENDNGTS